MSETSGRSRATVLVGPFAGEPFALGLRAMLLARGDVDVVAVDDLATVGRAAPPGVPSVLVVEGRDPAACREHLGAGSIHSVVVVDTVRGRAFVGLDNPTFRRLAEIVRVAAVEMLAEHPPPAHGADATELAPLAAWIELGLGCALRRRFGRDAPGVPGWSVAPAEAFEALGFDTVGDTEAELTARLAVADDDLVVLRSTLPPSIARIAEAFALSDRELRLLCLVLAPELDGRYATAVGVLQDDLTRRRPGLTLLAESMVRDDVGPWELRRTVHASRSMGVDGLIRSTGADALPVDAGLAPGHGVVAHLLAPSTERAVADCDAVLHVPAPETSAPLCAEEEPAARRLRRAAPSVVHLVDGGPDRAWFLRLTAAVGLPTVVGDLERLGLDRRGAAVDDWGVLARLVDGALVVLGADALPVAERDRIGTRLAGIARHVRVVATDAAPAPGTPVLPMSAPSVPAAQRSTWWTRAAARAGVTLGDGDAQRLAATAPVEPERMQRSAVTAAEQGPAAGSPVARLQRAARALSATPLPQGVRRVRPVYDWDDIVLPDAQRELLRSVPQHVLQAGRVLEEWGFARRMPYGCGVTALFSGPSGTGKTMASQIIAADLGVDLLQVDLSKTVSKYIGETEKNLDRVFDAAETTGSVLLFDEADAIFGKRTEIRDAHDRHANVEVAYLLQRMEAFRGLAVLTTNLRQNIDDAFVRRLRFVVEFALPAAAERELIWRAAFPAGAPLAPDVDVARLAGRLQISPGTIQSSALHAAFLAAGEGGVIRSAHLLAATRRELVKIGMLAAERSLAEPAAVGA